MSTQDRLRQWHRLFGINLMELFAGTRWQVELERELALTSQLLDVVIIETTAAVPEQPLQLPDGFDNLRPRNLLTYKSRHESLDAWTLDELIGHYVNDRKTNSEAKDCLRPTEDFGLYAVTTRQPQALAKHYPLQPVADQSGIYDLRWGSHIVRIIVLNAIAPKPHNAHWALFASARDRIRQGMEHYRAQHHAPSGHWALLERLYLTYLNEAPDMAYTMEEFLHETKEMMLAHLTPDERLRGLDPEEVLKRYDPETRLQGLDSDEVFKHYDPETRLQGLDPDLIEAWLKKQRRDH